LAPPVNKLCAHHFFVAFKKLNSKAGDLSPSTKDLGFKVKPNQRSQAELMGVFQAHRESDLKGSENICTRQFIIRETYDFPAVSHLHGGFRNSCSQSLYYQRLNFCSPPSQILVTVLSLLSRLSNWSFPRPKCTPSSSLP